MFAVKRCASLAVLLAVVLLAGLNPSAVSAQPPKDESKNPAGDSRFDSIGTKGPTKGTLGSEAEIQVPPGFLFIPQSNMARFMQMTGNLNSPTYRGALYNTVEKWFIVFEFDPIGYVKDDEKDKLGDAAGLLAEQKKSTEAGNEERRKHGLDEISVAGWHTPPYYDSDLKSLAFALRLQSKKGGGEDVNFESHILGRNGDMKVVIVGDPSQMNSAVSKYKELVKGFSYNAGQKYSDFKQGDKVAEYGLYALAAGGGVALLAKSGILMKLIKPIIFGVVVLFGVIAKFFKKITGRGE